MNNNELNAQADLIWSTLNCQKNINKSKSEQIELIQEIIFDISASERSIGRNEILNHISLEIINLR
jgi:hypothetical protein